MSSVELGGRHAQRLEAVRLEPGPSVTDDWAGTPEEQAQAARIDRLAGDRELVDLLRRQGFAGPDFQRAAEELVRYGVAVMTSWLLNGTIFERCARKGRPVERPPAGALDRVEAESMAGEVVAVSLAHFRDDVLVPGQWDPARGASLTTFFVGQCVLRFPNIYRAWLVQLPSYRLDEEAVLDVNRTTTQAVDDDVIRDRMSVDALRMVRSDEARKALVLVACGYSHPEIAAALGKTDKAVERMIAYARKQVRRAQQEGQESA